MSAPRKPPAKKVPARRVVPTGYEASIFPGTQAQLHEPLASALGKLQAQLGLPVWMLLQDGSGPDALLTIDDPIVKLAKHDLESLPDGPLALVVNSPGGDARSAYLLARILRRRCHDYVAVVPDAAMSAATLLTLGASKIIMGVDSYIGPLDAQIFDHDTESYGSVLNEVQSLERLRAYSLESIDDTMYLLAQRTGKRIDTLLPAVLAFVAESTRPLLEKIDVVHYTERARVLKVGEEYARRLLVENYPAPNASRIAAALVNNYPEHGFPIGREDAAGELKLNVEESTPEMDKLMEDLWQAVQGVVAVGAFRPSTVSSEGGAE